MQFIAQSQWPLHLGRSILKKNTSPGGQVIYKGPTTIYEEDEKGDLRPEQVHRFLVRVGKKHSELVTGTKEDAKAAVLRLLAKPGGASPIKGSSMTLQRYLRDGFLPRCRERNLAPKTCRHYEQDCENHIIPTLGKLRLGRIPATSIRQFLRGLREKGLSPRHVRNIYGCLRLALNEAVAAELIETHDARREKINLRSILKPSKRERVQRKQRERLMAWGREEVQHFLRVAPNDEELTRMAVVGCRTGMRPGELCARTWDDLDGDALNIWTSVYENDEKARKANPNLPRWEIGPIKNDWDRVLELDSECLAVLREQRTHVRELLEKGKITSEAVNYIFPAQGGEKPFSNPAKLYERWRFYVMGNKNKRVEKRDPRRGGRPPRKPLKGVRFINLYGFRHTCATELIRQRVSVPVIAERLGTSEEMIHRHYGHVLQEMQVEAVENLPAYGFRVPSSEAA